MRGLLLFACLGLALAFPPALGAQYAQVRSVHGVVKDGKGRPVPGAIVQIKNTKTLEIRSYITKGDGDYFFPGLSTEVDYEIRARHGKQESDAKTLSQFDSRKDAVVNLEIPNAES